MSTAILILGSLPAGSVRAQVEILAESSPQEVFGGKERTVQLRIRNPGTETIEANLQVRLWQASSSTALPVGEVRTWKSLRVLPGQTLLESARQDFPEARHPTDYVLRWSTDGGKAVGMTRVVVQPGDLLKALRTLAGGEPILLFDPARELAPLLDQLEVAHADLAEAGGDALSARLAIVGPFSGFAEPGNARPESLPALAARVPAVVWVERPDRLGAPALRLIRKEERTLVVLPAALILDLPSSASAQRELVRAATLARSPQTAEPAEFKP